MVKNNSEDVSLLIAAEDFEDEQFLKYHSFTLYDENIIKKLIAHGPVLIRGGRGSGKSALLRAANLRVKKDYAQNILGFYISLRYLPLLKTKGDEYEKYFCDILIKNILSEMSDDFTEEIFDCDRNISETKNALRKLSTRLNKRIILFFDDAAHIGRESSLKTFFDIYRTLSSSTVACKAAIYPGVTEFGPRFDILNDAYVIDIARSEKDKYFIPFFKEILINRYGDSVYKKANASKTITIDDFSGFLGRSVAGNVRAFLFACNYIDNSIKEDAISINSIDATLKYLSQEHFWPLIEELKPKLGIYETIMDVLPEISEAIFKSVGSTQMRESYGPSFIIHRSNIERLKKLFEILEYTGFVAKSDASRGLKSGGRGTKYNINLSLLLEQVVPSRLTQELFKKWLGNDTESVEFGQSSILSKFKLPEPDDKELGVLNQPIEVLKKSNAYPYGLTEAKIEKLREGGFDTVEKIFNASEDDILNIDTLGQGWYLRIQNILGQAIWM